MSCESPRPTGGNSHDLSRPLYLIKLNHGGIINQGMDDIPKMIRILINLVMQTKYQAYLQVGLYERASSYSRVAANSQTQFLRLGTDSKDNITHHFACQATFLAPQNTSFLVLSPIFTPSPAPRTARDNSPSDPPR